MFPVGIECAVNCTKGVVEWEAFEIGVWWENHVIALTDVSKNAGRWIHDGEV